MSHQRLSIEEQVSVIQKVLSTPQKLTSSINKRSVAVVGERETSEEEAINWDYIPADLCELLGSDHIDLVA